MEKRKKLTAALMAVILSAVFAVSGTFVNVHADENAEAFIDADTSSTEEIVGAMSLDEKISQMIIPAFRTWNDEAVTDLNKVPELEAALRKHQYGGVILYAININGTEQVTRLVSDLQKNNAQNENVSVKIPYMMSLDEEGGNKVRIASATRMPGNMAVGATGENAADNAFTEGRVIGEEISALGFNVDFAPVMDVNNNPSNPIIGIRSFSDDPQAVAALGVKYNEGLNQSNVIGTYKHFPGHGDTDVDSHIGTPTVIKTYEELQQTELVPFKNAIANGADMIMTAHITYPLVDEQQTFPDGTKGYYPATMSRKMMKDILRGDLGFDGVIVTDALEMGGVSADLVPGEPESPEYAANIAEKVIDAGVDILLLPRDMNSPDNAAFYDSYIEILSRKVENGEISADRINESVTRILDLKKKYKITETDTSGDDIDRRIVNAERILGSEEHHDAEMNIAADAVTLVKNDKLTLPLTGYEKNIVFVGRNEYDNMTIEYSLSRLQEAGLLPEDARIENLVTGEIKGSKESTTKITIDYYFEDNTAFHFTDNLKMAISEADAVIAFGKTAGISDMTLPAAQQQAIPSIIADAHDAGARFIYLSDWLPYDAARYQDSDAIVLAYMGEGLDIDPAQRSAYGNMPAYNANVAAAIMSMFDKTMPRGKLPVNIPVIDDSADKPVYTDEILYERGYGLGYTYEFFEGADSSYEKNNGEGLMFKNNARADVLTRLLVDGTEADKSYAAGPAYTTVTLPADYLDMLENGTHTLTAVYYHDGEEIRVETTFTVTGEEASTEATDPTGSADPTEATDPTGSENPTEGTDPTGSADPTDNTGTSPSESTASQKSKYSYSEGGKASKADRSDGVSTGDSNNMIIWYVLGAAAAGVLVTSVAVRKKKD